MKREPDLVLIKHSLPEIDPKVEASQWRLSRTGQDRCRLLAEKLPSSIDIFVSSHEPKAAETARILAECHRKDWEVLPGLHEHDRANVPFLPHSEFEAIVARFFRERDLLVMGRETAEEAYRRFDEAVGFAMERHRKKQVAIVSHGTVISLFVGRGTEDSGYDLWRRLGLPSFIVLHMPERRIVQLVEQI